MKPEDKKLAEEILAKQGFIINTDVKNIDFVRENFVDPVLKSMHEYFEAKLKEFYKEPTDSFTTPSINKIESITLLEGLSNQEKEKYLNEFIQMTAKATLQLFMMLGLKTHIEAFIVNESTKQEFIFSFKTVDEYLKQRKP